MQWLITAVLFLLVLTAQAAARPYLAVFDASPDLLLILVVQFTLLAPRLDGVIGSWLMGLVADLHGGSPAGILAMTYALIALVIYHTRGQIFAGHILTRLFLVAVADLLQHLALMFSQIIRGQEFSFLLFWSHALLGVAYTAVVALVLLPLLSLLLRSVYGKPRQG